MSISSLKDLGYQQAKTGDSLDTQAQFALDNITGFPEDVPRRSILLYYYTKEPRPDDQIKIKQPHSALWKKKGFKDKQGKKTRDFT